MSSDSANLNALKTRLAENQDGILEHLAMEYGVTLQDVISALPGETRTIVAGAEFERVMTELTGWGEVLLVVHTADAVIECAGAIPPGSIGRGYFNFHGDSPISGHIKFENCSAIAFLDRPFMGRPSRSIVFLNRAGGAMFKVFVRRDQARALLPEQVAKFDPMRAHYRVLPR